VSKQSQQQFLENLDKLLQEKAGEYRTARANKVSHVFIVSRRAINRGISDTIDRKFKTDSTQRKQLIKSKLETDINTFTTTTIDILDGLVKQRDSKIRVRKLSSGQYDARYIFFASKADEAELSNVYRTIYKTYIDNLQDLAVRVGSVVTEVTGRKIGNKAKNYWNLEHGEYQGVVESQVADALNTSLSGISDMPRAEVLKWLETQGVDLRIIRDTRTSTMEVHIGSKYGNIGEGVISRDRKIKLRNVVSKALTNQSEIIANLPGSDSFNTIKRKKIVRDSLGRFAKVKDVKVTTENTKVRHSKVSVESKKIRNSTKPGQRGAGIKSAAAGTAQRPARPSGSMLQMMNIINAHLSRTVQKNMNPPALENRTGRFAESVRVTDITKTPQGFPSIGYTYAKFPYQTFEVGYKQGSVERDPRSLIETSIREIAAGLAIGRFYTRRL